MGESKQICSTVDSDLYNDIQEMADKEGRKLAQMAAILLQLAVKERKRQRNKKKNAKEDGSANI